MASGFQQDEVVYLPTDYAAADEILRSADLAVVFGGDDVVKKYQELTVQPNGPGRSKIVISGTDGHDHVDLIVDSAAHGGGAGCVNVTGVYADGDVKAVAEEVGWRLSQLPNLALPDGTSTPTRPEHTSHPAPLRSLQTTATWRTK